MCENQMNVIALIGNCEIWLLIQWKWWKWWLFFICIYPPPVYIFCCKFE